MTESIDRPRVIPGKDRPGGRRKDHSAHRGDYMPPSQVERLKTQGQTTFEELTQATQQPAPAIKTPDATVTQINPETPEFGDNATQTEQERWLTLGKDAWFYDSPMWDPQRERLGRVDQPVAVKVIQEVRGPKGRLAVEVQRTYKDSEGIEQTRKFWVHPKPGGFDGMPSNRVSRPTLKLKTQP